MKKSLLLTAILVVASAVAVAPVFAQVVFTVSAQVPASTGVNFVVSRVVGTVFTKQAANFTNLNFGVLALDPVNQIFLPDHGWVIDVAPNGASRPDLSVSYQDTGNPTGVPIGQGLAQHGTITFAEVVFGPPETTNVIDGMSLGQSNGTLINETQFANGFLRMFLGIATGDPALDEGTATPFTAVNAAGTYTGELTLTATFDVP